MHRLLCVEDRYIIFSTWPINTRTEPGVSDLNGDRGSMRDGSSCQIIDPVGLTIEGLKQYSSAVHTDFIAAVPEDLGRGP